MSSSLILFVLVVLSATFLQLTDAGCFNCNDKKPKQFCEPGEGECVAISHRLFDRCNIQGSAYYRGSCPDNYKCHKGDCFPSGMSETDMDAQLVATRASKAKSPQSRVFNWLRFRKSIPSTSSHIHSPPLDSIIHESYSHSKPPASLLSNNAAESPSNSIPFITTSLDTDGAISHLDQILSVDNPKKVYRDIIKIGQGGQGSVYIARNIESGEAVAIKTMNFFSQPFKVRPINEILIMKHSHHDNIVNFVDAFRSDRDIWIVMEYMDAGSLKGFISRLRMTEGQIAGVCREILKGLSYLHAQGIVHRDIRSNNIVLSRQGQVKVADFGVCDLVNEQRNKLNDIDGSYSWMAPEMVAWKEYGLKADIWAFGILVIEMIEGEAPYEDQAELIILDLIAKNGAPTLKNPDNLSLVFREFLANCLQVDEKQRPTADELLGHQFLNSVEKPATFLPLLINAAQDN